MRDTKELEKWLKRSLKRRISITQSAIITFLITGIFASIPSMAEYLVINPDKGSVSEANGKTKNPKIKYDTILLAPHTNDNLGIDHAVVIGSGSRGAASSISIGYDSQVLKHIYTTQKNGNISEKLLKQPTYQTTVIGFGAKAGFQSVAVGADTFALGQSSIAIGSDDIIEYYKNVITDYDYKKYFKKLYDLKNPEEKIDKKEFKHLLIDYKHKYSASKNRKYSPTIATGSGAISIGSRSLAFDTGSTAVGTLAFALGERATAVGTLTRAEGDGSIALGSESYVFSDNSVATGNKTQVLNQGGLAYGYKSYSAGKGSIAIGRNVYSNVNLEESDKDYKKYLGSKLSRIDEINTYTAKLEKIVDEDFLKATVKAKNGVENVIVQKDGKDSGIVIGSNAAASGDNSVAIGRGSLALEDNSFAIGSYSVAKGTNAIAVGLASRGLGENSIALGTASFVEGKNSTSTGTGTKIVGNDSASFGYNNDIQGDRNIAFGNQIKISNAEDSLAIGVNSKVEESKENSRKQEKVKKAIALGNGAIANLSNSVALGTDSETDYKLEDLTKPGYTPLGGYSAPSSKNIGVISVGRIGGERRIVNLAPGYKDTDAVNVYQLKLLENRIRGEKDDTKQDTVRYISVNDTVEGGLANKAKIAADRLNNIEKYIKLTAYQKTLELRKADGDSSLTDRIKEIEQKELKDLKNEILKGLKGGEKTELEDKLGKLKVSKIGKPEVNNLNRVEKFGEKVEEIENAEDKDLEKAIDILSSAEKKELTETNFRNDLATNKDTIAIGYKAKSDSEGSIVLGINSSSNGKKDVTILGNTITANVTNSVYLGNGSKAYEANGQVTKDSKHAGANSEYSSQNIEGIKNPLKFAGGKSNGVVTVGAEGKEKRIQNVAAGAVSEKSTDAINGSQLYATLQLLKPSELVIKGGKVELKDTKLGDNFVKSSDIVNVINSSGFNIQSTDGDKTLVKPGDTVTFKSENNLSVKHDNKTVTYSLNKELKDIDSIQISSNGPLISKTGIDNNNKKITKLADATDDTDAVNLKTLKKHGVVIKAGKNVKVTQGSENTDNIPHKTYTIDAEKTTVGNGDGIEVKQDNKDDQNVTKYTISLSKEIKEKIQKGEKASDDILNKGITFTSDETKTNVTTKLGGTLAVKGDNKNISTTIDGNGIKIALKDTIDLGKNGSITLGGITINKDGITTSNEPKNDNSVTNKKYVDGSRTTVESKNGSINVTDSNSSQDGKNKAYNIEINTSKVNLTYKANNQEAKTTTLSNGLNFKNGINTTAAVEENGIVKFNLNPTLEKIEGIKFGNSNGNSTENNELSITTTGGIKAGGKKISNVEAGTDDKDAINLNQLNQAKTELKGLLPKVSSSDEDKLTVETLNGNDKKATEYKLKVNTTKIVEDNTNKGKVKLEKTDEKDRLVTAGDVVETINNAGFNVEVGSNKSLVKNGETLKFEGDGNLKVTNTNNSIKYALNKDVNLGNDGSITLGGIKINKDGITTSNEPKNDNSVTNKKYVDGSRTTVTSSDESIKVVDSNENKQDKNKAYDLKVDTEKVSLTYKANDQEAKTTTLSNGLNFKNGINTTATIKDSGVVTFDINKELTGIDKIAFGNKKNGNDIVLISKDGINAGGKKITNIEDGTTNKDAVNFGQLEKVKTDLTKALPTVSSTNETVLSVSKDKSKETNSINYKLTVNTTKVIKDNENQGKVKLEKTDEKEKNKLVTAGDVVEAINNAGFNVKVKDGDKTLVKTGDTLKFEGDENLKVTSTNNSIKYELNKKIDLGENGSIKIGDTVIKKGDIVVNKAPATNNSVTNKSYVLGTRTIVKSTDESVSITKSTDEKTNATTYDLKVDVSKIAANTDLRYRANDTGDKTVKLSKGLNFKDGTNTSAIIDNDGVVKFNLKPDLKGINKVVFGNENEGDNVVSISKEGIKGGNKQITNVGSGLGITPIDKLPDEGKSKDLISGTNGLTSKTGTVLNTVSTLADLQTLAKAGLDFAGDDNKVVHRILGTQFTIKGNAPSEAKLSDKNIRVVKDDANGANGVVIKLAKNLTNLSSIDFNETLGNNQKKPIGVITGLQDISTTASGDTAVNKKYVDGAQTVVYTDKDGNRLIKVNDKFYKASEYNKDDRTTVDEIPSKDVIASLVDPNNKGDAIKNPTVLSNIKGVLSNSTKGNEDTDITNIQKDIEKLISDKEADENKAANLNDIRGLAKAGLNFTTDGNGKLHKKLGNTLSIKGDNNITTSVEGENIKISLNKNVTLGNEGSIKIGDTEIKNGDITVKKAPTTNESVTNKSYVLGTRTIVTSNDKSVEIVETTDSKTDAKTYDLKVDATKVAANTDLTYKANGKEDKKVKLSQGLNFSDGTNTNAVVEDNGIVKFNLNTDLTGINKVVFGEKENSDIVSISKDGIKAGDKRISNVASGKDEKDAVNVSQLTKVKDVIGTGSDGRDNIVEVIVKTNGSDDVVTYYKASDLDENGKPKGNAVAIKGNKLTAGAHGLTKEDGLNGKDLTTKINALRNGEAGLVVYTDKDGNRLVKDNKGDFYKKNEVDKDGNAKNEANKVEIKDVVASVVNPAGLTTETTTLQNVASALGLSPVLINDNKVEKTYRVITEENAKKAVEDLLKDERAHLDRVTTLADLQAVAKAGLYFIGDDNQKIHRSLGTELTIKGNADKNASLSEGNIRVVKDVNGLIIKLAKRISDLEAIDFNKKETNGNIKANGIITGLKDIDATTSGDTAVNKNYVDNSQVVVYTNEQGEKVVKVNDKFYTSNQIGKNGKPNGEAITSDKVIASIVNPNNTKANEPTTLGNIKGVLEKTTKGNSDSDIKSIQQEVSKIAKDTTSNDNRAANLNDIRGLAKAGLNFVGDDSKEIHKNLGDSLKIKGDSKNIKTSVDGGNIQIELKSEIVLDDKGSIKIGKTEINKDGIKVTNKPTENAHVTNKEYVDGTRTKVKSADGSVKVTQTTDANNAITYDLKVDTDVIAKSTKLSYKANGENKEEIALSDGLNFTNGDNTKAEVGKDGVVKFNLNKDLTDINSIKFGQSGPSISKDSGIDAGSKKITGLLAGEKETDAVNFGQLTKSSAESKTEVKAGTNVNVTSKKDDKDGHTIYTVNADKTTLSSGKGITVTKGDKNKTTNETDYSVALSKETEDKIQKGVEAKTTVDNKGITFVGTNGEILKKLGDKIGVKGSDSNISTTVDKDGIKIELNKKLDLGESGEIKLGDTVIKHGDIQVKEGPKDGNSVTNKTYVDGTRTQVTSKDNSIEIKETTNANNSKTYDLTVDTSVVQLGYKANGGTTKKVSLKEGLNFKNGTNTTAVIGDNGEVKFNLNEDISGIKSIEVDGNTLNKDGLSIKGGPSILEKGIDAGNKRITGVLEGVEETDAVNLGQLNKAVETINGGIATSVAMANLPQIAGKGHNVAAAYGTYKGHHSVAVGLSGTDPSGSLVYKASGALTFKGDISLGIGFGYQFGQQKEQNKIVLLEEKLKDLELKNIVTDNKIKELEDAKKEARAKIKALEDNKKETDTKLKHLEELVNMLLSK